MLLRDRCLRFLFLQILYDLFLKFYHDNFFSYSKFSCLYSLCSFNLFIESYIYSLNGFYIYNDFSLFVFRTSVS